MIHSISSDIVSEFLVFLVYSSSLIQHGESSKGAGERAETLRTINGVTIGSTCRKFELDTAA